MEARPTPTEASRRGGIAAPLLRRALLVDLEVSHQGAILKLGAILGSNTLARSGHFDLPDVLEDLSEMAQAASCVVGHNLIRHDLRVLSKTAAGHPLLRLPVIDTLVLSPIAFPENPYHRLVKDYKLVRESVNDPVADARQAASLFADECHSLDGLRQTEPRLFELLHFLLATPDVEAEPLASGMDLVFRALGGARPTEADAIAICREIFARWGCASVPPTAALLQTSAQRLSVAYAVTWLRVAGSNSVLPPWVRMEFPATVQLIRGLREVPCGSPDCAYCQRVHDAKAQLQSFFALPDFRERPQNPEGGSLQKDIVEAGLRDESLLAILPTGAGKSLCFQLPALVRNYRLGVLTIVISPLQALMKDQVDSMVRRTRTPFAAALYGILTPLERGDVLRNIASGDVPILYVSPEQLRNRSFSKAIAQREVGCWVFDEAHCLSKWGHDFRPDYLYAGRFIRQFAKSQSTEIPAIACFTATAKNDVKDEILAYFKNETGRDLKFFEGGVERDNLRFTVQMIQKHGKAERVHDLLSDRLANGRAGSAIVFCAKRAATEDAAKYLQSKGWDVAHFHAGLTPTEKKETQERFLAGDLQVICATNAFGMGIDKDDVRLVIHADTPGSLENYLQEAGRAGRDGQKAECVLLYDEQDCEQQFQLGAMSELSRRDIAQILRRLRKAARGEDQSVVITTGEILRDEDFEANIHLNDRDADTKVRTAIAWLERADFIQRDENVTTVFQARPLVKDLPEAEAKMASLNLSANERALWLAILREVMNTSPTESLTVDRLALLPEFTSYARSGFSNSAKPVGPEFVSARIIKLLRSMADAGLMKRDTLLNAFVRHKVGDHSRMRLDRVLQLDRRMVDLLAIEEPDPEGWMALSLRLLNQRLCEEKLPASPELLLSLLKSLREDGRGFAGTHGSVELRHISHDACRVRVRRPWTAIADLAEKRRRVASIALETILQKIPSDTPASSELLVGFSFEELHAAIERDLWLRSELKDRDAALERALMFLHEQQVILLRHGLAVFRSAMTIRLQPQARGEKYKLTDYQPLAHHYRERILQVHVMSEYARRGLERIQEALALVLAYFTLEKGEFLRRYFGNEPELLKHATTAQSYQRIVTDLSNAAQMKVVMAPVGKNMLILAGPGSGKTKTVVHRCAYLLRVERVRPQSVLVCCFNRHAAIELRRRLTELAGDDARGVTVLTYHGLAMRLLGYSFAASGQTRAAEINFDELITDAVKLLRGEKLPPGIEPDELRDRLLAGFQHILVDEYQDIDEPQYEMISALAGRTLDDPDLKLSILAVGDDDQNIYTFRGANVEFIRRFKQDYDAETHYLVENYRSTRHIIETANQLIAANTDRMKTDRPICIDRHRAMHPAGGDFGQRDLLTGGMVQVVRVFDAYAQAEAVIAEIHRLRKLGVAEWSRIAVLSSSHRELSQVRGRAESEGIPIRWVAQRGAFPPLHQIREVRRYLQHLATMRNSLRRANDLIEMAREMFSGERANSWVEFLDRLLDTWMRVTSDADVPVHDALEFLYETCAESRREFSFGEGVTLSTVHSAKGTEHDHVLLIGSWPLNGDRIKQEEIRRTFYVGMTRARKTLAVLDRQDIRPSLPAALVGLSVEPRDFQPQSATRRPIQLNYETLRLESIHLGYPAQFPARHKIHAALALLRPGSRLQIRAVRDNGVGLFDEEGTCVSRLARKEDAMWLKRIPNICEVRVLAMVHRTAEQDAVEARRAKCQVTEWEVPMVEVVYQENESASSAAAATSFI